MKDEQTMAVLAAMLRLGGRFVQSLAQCFIAADANNFAILRNAFPDIWNKYEAMAEKEAA